MTDKRLKICCICNDKAIGKNFGAVTCESCKAFFRRTALKTKLKCPFDDQCQINTVTRKFCQKCRIKKCFAMGMKIESLVNDKHRESIRKSIEYKRKLSEESDYFIDTTPRVSPDSTQYGFSHKNRFFEVLNDYKSDLFDIYSADLDLNGKVFRRSLPAIDRPIDRNNFNEFEGIKLTEVLNAIPIITDPYIENANSEIIHLDQMRTATTYKFIQDIGNLVNFSKNLSAFRDMCDEDQIALIKFGCTEVLSLRSIMIYDTEAECFHICMDKDNQRVSKLQLDLFRYIKRHVYDTYKNYLRLMSGQWESDPMIINMLSVIMLFNPNLSEVTHKDVIHLHQKTYMYLLQKYLQLKCGSEYLAREKLTKLVAAMKEVYELAAIFRLNAAEKEDMHPFLAEIYDAPSKSPENTCVDSI